MPSKYYLATSPPLPDERRAEILTEIERLWEKYPNWTFTQLVSNILTLDPPSARRTVDMASFEDSDLLPILQSYPDWP
jgi:hypothetical protein